MSHALGMLAQMTCGFANQLLVGRIGDEQIETYGANRWRI
jgi:hypothetical protein